eukprot:4246944-Pleurochrysis_carterae.AAC.2
MAATNDLTRTNTESGKGLEGAALEASENVPAVGTKALEATAATTANHGGVANASDDKSGSGTEKSAQCLQLSRQRRRRQKRPLSLQNLQTKQPARTMHQRPRTTPRFLSPAIIYSLNLSLMAGLASWAIDVWWTATRPTYGSRGQHPSE